MRRIALVNASSALAASLAYSTTSKSTAMWTSNRENRCSASSPTAAAGSAISNSPIAGIDCMANTSLTRSRRVRQSGPLAGLARNALDCVSLDCAGLDWVALDWVAAPSYRSQPMSWRQYALMLWLAVAVVRAACGQTLLGSQSGVLVLRNGYVLHGAVTRAGDYYIVSQGEGIELQLKNDQVELFCGSMDEAYEFKVRHL